MDSIGPIISELRPQLQHLKFIEQMAWMNDNIHFVGNVMIDTLYQNMDRIVEPNFWKEFQLRNSEYFLSF